MNEVLFQVKHRHTVLTMPMETREAFRVEPKLLSDLATSDGKMLLKIGREAAAGKWSKKQTQVKIPKDAKSGIIIRIETEGGTANHNPHLHALETEGCYSPNEKEDRYYPGSFIPYWILRHRWMNVVLNLLVNFGKISKETAQKLRTKYKKGFNVNSQIRDHGGDKELMYRQAQYIQKAPVKPNWCLNTVDSAGYIWMKSSWTAQITT